MDNRERELWRGVTSAAGLVGQLGFAVVTPIVLCAVVGVRLDHWLGAHGIVVFAMIVLGLVSGGYAAYRMLARVLRDKQ